METTQLIHAKQQPVAAVTISNSVYSVSLEKMRISSRYTYTKRFKKSLSTLLTRIWNTTKKHKSWTQKRQLFTKQLPKGIMVKFGSSLQVGLMVPPAGGRVWTNRKTEWTPTSYSPSWPINERVVELQPEKAQNYWWLRSSNEIERNLLMVVAWLTQWGRWHKLYEPELCCRLTWQCVA